MFAAIGLVVLLGMVFGGFAFTGGNLEPILESIPHEMIIIGGAAVGAIVAGNSMKELKQFGGGFMKVLKGPKYKKKDYLDTIFLVSSLMKMLRTDGPVALEPHIEDPKASSVFGQYPKLLKDSTLIHMITDTLRLVVISSGTLDPMAVEDVMDNALKTHHHDDIRPADMLQGLADALPALGIVAAVLGVVKTMGSIDKPPSILGAMIGSGAGRHLHGHFASLWYRRPVRQPLPPGDRKRRRDLRHGQADHHRLAPRPPAAAGDRGRAVGNNPFEPAGLRRSVRRHARALRRCLIARAGAHASGRPRQARQERARAAPDHR